MALHDSVSSMTGQPAAAVVLLNGASSSGKSTLARALQAHMDEPFLRYSLDLFLFGGAFLPVPRGAEGPFSWTEMRPKVFEGFFRSPAAFAGAGNNLIVDHVMETPEQYRRLIALLAPFDVFYVGLHCPLSELERRERQRGDRRTGDARRDHAIVHCFGPYDAEVDSTRPADENAAALVAAWKARRRPGMFSA